MSLAAIKVDINLRNTLNMAGQTGSTGLAGTCSWLRPEGQLQSIIISGRAVGGKKFLTALILPTPTAHGQPMMASDPASHDSSSEG